MLVSGKTYLECFNMADSWHAYRNAMNRRRPGSALNQNDFGRYVKKSFVYMSNHGSCLVGQFHEYNGKEIFCVSHHCPASHRDMVCLLKKLCHDKNLKVCFSVTSDLVGMLQKIGFFNTGEIVPCTFRGDVVMKHILTNFGR